MRLCFASVICLALVGCGDTVTSRYETLAAARADQLFVHGWLPDLLPTSSHAIRVSTNVDLNISEGEFFFLPEEFPLLQAQLQPFGTAKHPFTRSFDDEIRRHRDRGLPVFQYMKDTRTWIFFCKPEKGMCEYTMWMGRS